MLCSSTELSFLYLQGLSLSDKYMQIEKQDRKKKKGKKKKRKKHGAEEESDEDIQPQHLVSTVVEMPEVRRECDHQLSSPLSLKEVGLKVDTRLMQASLFVNKLVF